jgi:hypothetical protein
MTPWEECPDVWKTQSEYFVWLRGQLRGIWSDYPVRTTFKEESCREVTPEEKEAKKFHPSTKKVGQCTFCKEWMAKSKLEVDHKIPSDGCTNFVEAEKFLWYCARPSREDMQLACDPCHKIKTYSERYNMTFEEAKIEKTVIAFVKDSGKKLTHILTTDFDYTPEQTSNDSKRRGAVRELVKAGEIK